MAIINHETRTIHCKIVYYGPGMAGKTSSLQYIHQATEPGRRGELLSIATETERTLFFDFTPVAEPKIGGYSVRFHLYTVPGCVLYAKTKIAVLRGVEGIVFVADSQRDKLEENINSLKQMVQGLYSHGKTLEDTPTVLQYNKRDLPNIVSISTLDKYLNPLSWLRFESIVWWWNEELGSQHPGKGVFETLNAIQRLVLEKLRRQYPEGPVP